MNALAIDIPTCGSACGSASSRSLEGIAVAQMMRRIGEDALSSYYLGYAFEALKCELSEIYEETRVFGWDGMTAAPIEELAVTKAFEFIDTFPRDIPMPELAPGPDGNIHFEWYFGPRRVITVCVSIDAELSFASLDGAKRLNGAEPFVGEFPFRLAELIEHYKSES